MELLYLFLWNSPEKFCIIFGMLEDKLRDIVKQRMVEERLDYGDLAKLAGVDRKSVQNFIEGTAGVRLHTVELILQALKIDLREVLEREREREEAEYTRVKVYGSIGASKEGLEPVDVVDEIILPLRIKKNGVIAFKVRGNSMHPSIVDGSIVLIDTNIKQPEHEKIFVFYMPYKGAVVKRTIFLNQDTIILKSDNELYGEFVFTRRDFELGEVMVVGKVILSIQKYS